MNRKLKRIIAFVLCIVMGATVWAGETTMLTGKAGDLAVTDTAQVYGTDWRDEYIVANVNVKEAPFYAKGDGVTDDTQAIQNALNAVEAGGIVYIPAGDYVVKGTLSVPDQCTLIGDWNVPSAENKKETVLLAYKGRGSETGTPFITMGVASTLKNISVYYPEQVVEDIRPYPYTIAFNGVSVLIDGVTLYNSYNGIHTHMVNGSAQHVFHVYGTPLNTGISFSGDLEVSELAYVDFGIDIWANSGREGAPVTDEEKSRVWELTQKATGINCNRNDDVFLYDIDVDGDDYANGLYFHNTATGDDLYLNGGGTYGHVMKLHESNVHVQGTSSLSEQLMIDFMDDIVDQELHSYTLSTGRRTTASTIVSIKQSPYNAVGDGVADDTEAIKKSIADVAGAGGGIVYIPAGQFKVTESITVPSNVELRGAMCGPKTAYRKQVSQLNVYADASGAPAVILAESSGVNGVAFYYPENNFEQLVELPYTIQGQGSNIWIKSVSFINSCDAIDLGTYECDNFFVGNTWGTAMRYGIHVGAGSDNGVLENTFFTYACWMEIMGLYDNQTALSDLFKTHAVSYTFENCKNLVGWSIFAFGSNIGVKMCGENGSTIDNATFYRMGLDTPNASANLLIENAGNVNIFGLSTANISNYAIHETGTLEGTVNVFGQYTWGGNGANSLKNPSKVGVYSAQNTFVSGGVNVLAPVSSVAASSTNSDYPTSNMNDELRYTTWQPAADDTNPTLTFTLTAPQLVKSIAIYHGATRSCNTYSNALNYTIQASTDGSSYTNIMTVTKNTDNITVHNIEDTTAQYFRIVFDITGQMLPIEIGDVKFLTAEVSTEFVIEGTKVVFENPRLTSGNDIAWEPVGVSTNDVTCANGEMTVTVPAGLTGLYYRPNSAYGAYGAFGEGGIAMKLKLAFQDAAAGDWGAMLLIRNKDNLSWNATNALSLYFYKDKVAMFQAGNANPLAVLYNPVKDDYYNIEFITDDLKDGTTNVYVIITDESGNLLKNDGDNGKYSMKVTGISTASIPAGFISWYTNGAELKTYSMKEGEWMSNAQAKYILVEELGSDFDGAKVVFENPRLTSGDDHAWEGGDASYVTSADGEMTVNIPASGTGMYYRPNSQFGAYGAFGEGGIAMKLKLNFQEAANGDWGAMLMIRNSNHVQTWGATNALYLLFCSDKVIFGQTLNGAQSNLAILYKPVKDGYYNIEFITEDLKDGTTNAYVIITDEAGNVLRNDGDTGKYSVKVTGLKTSNFAAGFISLFTNVAQLQSYSMKEGEWTYNAKYARKELGTYMDGDKVVFENPRLTSGSDIAWEGGDASYVTSANGEMTVTVPTTGTGMYYRPNSQYGAYGAFGEGGIAMKLKLNFQETAGADWGAMLLIRNTGHLSWNATNALSLRFYNDKVALFKAGETEALSVLYKPVKDGYYNIEFITDDLEDGTTNVYVLITDEAGSLLRNDGDDGEYTMKVTGIATADIPAAFISLYTQGTELKSYSMKEGEWTYNVSSRLLGHTVTLGGKTGVNFLMKLDNSIVEDANAFMRFTYNGMIQDVPVADAELTAQGYKFTCEVAAKEMADTITAQLFSGDTAIGDAYPYTVKQYAEAIVANASVYGEPTAALTKAMLNYGANAQTYFNHNISSLANSTLSDTEKDLSSITAETLADYAKTTEQSHANIGKLAGSSLVLESETTLKLYFSLADGVDVNNLTFYVGGPDREDVQVEAIESGDYYYVSIENIAVHNLNADYVVKVSDGTNTLEATYSAMSYCYNVLNRETTSQRTEALKNVVRALYMYNQAADAYLGGN